MEIPLLKTSPEDAVLTLDRLIVEGYGSWNNMELECNALNNNPLLPETIEQWKKNFHNWFIKSIQTLNEVFISERYSYMFVRAPRTTMDRIGFNGDVDRIMTNFEKRIGVLNSYIDFIYQHFNVKVSVVAKRDAIVQTGNNSTTEVKNEN